MDTQTIKRIRNGLVSPEVGPETIALMLSKTCNLRCLYCLGGKHPPADTSEDLTTKELFELFKDARDFKVRDINLGGFLGEPFCRSDIIDIIQEIKRMGLSGTMTTNGSFLNARIAKIVSDCGWDIIRISLDSVDGSIQYAMRPAVNKKPYFQGIVEFLDTLQKIDSKVTIILNTVISKHNFRGLPALLKFANIYKNVESLNILKLLNMGLLNYEALKLNNEEIQELNCILSELKNEKKLIYQDNWSTPENIEKDTDLNRKSYKSKRSNQRDLNRCFVNYYILSIDSDGLIMKCPQYQTSVPARSIKKTPLRILWKNELLETRQGLLENAPCYKDCCTILKEENKLIFNSLK